MGMLCWRPNICKCHDKSCSDEKKTNLQKKSKILVKDPELSLFFHFHLRQIGSKSDSAVLSLLKKYQRTTKKAPTKHMVWHWIQLIPSQGNKFVHIPTDSGSSAPRRIRWCPPVWQPNVYNVRHPRPHNRRCIIPIGESRGGIFVEDFFHVGCATSEIDI